MLKVIVKTINVVTACYVVYLVGGAVYEMGKAAGKKENAAESVPVGAPDEANNNPDYKIIDGAMYKRVK
jgi:hypothetical protein